MLGQHRQRAHFGCALQFLAQWPGQIGHGLEVRSTLLVDPAKQLGGAKALFPTLVAPRGQTLEVEVEQVGQHVKGYRE